MTSLYYHSNKFKLALFIFFITFFAIYAFPQDTTGTIDGSVRDPSGAAVPNASITLTPKACKCSECNMNSPCPICCAPQEKTTDEEGNFRFTNVTLRSYIVKAESSGFKPTSREVTPQIGATSNLNIVLDAGSSDGQVTIGESGTTCDLVCLLKKLFKKLF